MKPWPRFSHKQSADSHLRGQGLIEYALILSLVAIVAIISVNLFGDSIQNTFRDVAGSGEFAPPDIGPLGGEFTPRPQTFTPTFTPTPSATFTPLPPGFTPSATPTASHTPTASPTATASNTPTATATATGVVCAYGPHSVPGRMEMEDYDCGGAGVAYNDEQATNLGGAYRTGEGVDIQDTGDSTGTYNIGWTRDGEWLRYKLNVTQSGVYNIAVRVASSSGSGQFRILIDGQDMTGLVNVPNTGGFQNWQNVNISNIGLLAGTRTLEFQINRGSVNYNYMVFTASVGTPTPTATATRTPTPTATFTPTPTHTPTITPSPTVATGGILFVVGNTSLSASDQLVFNRLQAKGYAVTVVGDSASTTANATGKVLVLISSTVSSSSVNTKFKSVTVPVMTWKTTLLDDMEMSTTTGTQSNQTQVEMVAANSGHPLSAGLTGTVTVGTSNSTYNRGQGNSNAIVIAIRSNGDTSRHMIFAYNAGATMYNSFNAPARRLAFYFGDDTAATTNANGWALFDAAITWSITGN